MLSHLCTLVNTAWLSLYCVNVDAGGAKTSSDDPLDAFMNVVCSESKLDGVERKKLHIHMAELRKEAQRLHRLVDLTRPTQLPSLQTW